MKGKYVSQRGQDYWEIFLKSLPIEKYSYNFGFFLESYQLFSQALLTFDAGAYVATSLLCRATIEAASYTILTRTKVEEGGFLIDPPKTLYGKVRTVFLPELKEGIKRKKILDKDQFANWKRIVDHGNLIAHFASTLDRDLLAALGNSKLDPATVKQWITKADAVKDIQDTTTILASIVRAIKATSGKDDPAAGLGE